MSMLDVLMQKGSYKRISYLCCCWLIAFFLSFYALGIILFFLALKIFIVIALAVLRYLKLTIRVVIYQSDSWRLTKSVQCD